MPRAEPPSSTDAIEALLQSGLEHYGRNQTDAAVDAWREVLRLDPHNEQALDFLQTAGFIPDKKDTSVRSFSRESSGAQVTPDTDAARPRRLAIANDEVPAPSSYVTANGDLADPVLRELLTDQRYEDALKHLYLLRSKSPRDEALSRSIRILREKLAEIYSDQLINLDRIPRLTSTAETYAFSSEERHVVSLVDGISSFGDILGASKLGRVPSLRILCQFQNLDLLNSSPSSLAPPRRLGTTRNVRKAAEQPSSQQYQPPIRQATQGGFITGSTNSQSSRATDARNHQLSQLPERYSGSVERVAEDPASGAFPSAPKTGLDYTDTVQENTEKHGKSATRSDIEYEARFAQATHSYLLRDFDRAIQLFRQCVAERPEDPRPQHNLKAIQKRIGKS